MICFTLRCLFVIPFLAVNASAQIAKTTVNPPQLPDTLQYGFSQATAAQSRADLIYVAGQIGLTQSGPNDFKNQVDHSFENLRTAVEAAGGTVDGILKITLLVKDIDERKLQYLVAKRRAFFGEHPPASTLIPVTALALPTLKFEIDAVAVATQKGGN